MQTLLLQVPLQHSLPVAHLAETTPQHLPAWQKSPFPHCCFEISADGVQALPRARRHLEPSQIMPLQQSVSSLQSVSAPGEPMQHLPPEHVRLPQHWPVVEHSCRNGWQQEPVAPGASPSAEHSSPLQQSSLN